MLVDRRPVLYYSIVGVSLLLASLVAIVPLPLKYFVLRPELVCLLVIYWVINTPQHLGVTFAFFTGLAVDLIEHTVWGAHALGLAVLAYVCLNAYQRIVSYSIWHQTLWVSVLVGVHQVLVSWVQSLNGYQSPMSALVASIIISTLLWPILVLGFLRLRQHFHIL